MMSEDAKLLQRYAAEHSEPAFAELVRRHVDLVYSAALRLLNGDKHGAQDLTQQVFSELARQAGHLARHPALVGWLYTTTRQMGWRAIRSSQRRSAREQMAQTMNEILQSSDEPDWDNLRPVLDEAMHELKHADRVAILLRFFKNRSLREVGVELGLTENAARMRVDRALEKLRTGLARKGVTSPAAALALALSGNAVISAPAGFVAGLAGFALAGAATESASIFGFLKLMAATKLKIGLTALAIVGVSVIIVREHAALLRARDDNETLLRQIAQLKADNDGLSGRLTRAMRARASSSRTGNGNAAADPKGQGVESAGKMRDRLIANPLTVTADQLKGYLDKHHRDAASLLAGFRVTHDAVLLEEAMQKYPNDPHVDFEAASMTNLTADAHRQWLDAFAKSAPDNALANYLSAVDYFKSGQPAQGLQEMAAASGKQGFQDYSTDRLMDDREAYLEAGYSLPEAEISSATQLLLPQLQQIKSLATDLVNLAGTYQGAGDNESAQSALEMTYCLGQRYANAAPAEAEISELVGMAVERMALGGMEPSAVLGENGQTVQDQLSALNQAKATLNELNEQAAPLMESMSDEDYLIYKDRWIAFGEEAALRWVIGKYGRQ